MPRWVVDLHDDAAADPALVGGKAAALHRMLRHGLPVPDAIVVTTEAFRTHFADAAPGTPPPAPELQTDLVTAMDRALRRHFATDTLLAVRSSASGEDSVHASFAGQHATYYDVTRSDVERAVTQCWLSLWSAAAETYRTWQAPAGEFAMAVLIQQMVRADRSGVCFTADPTGLHPGQVVIEATWGLGAALVDGRVSPDRLILDRDGRLLQRHTARKLHRISDGRGAVRLEAVPLSQQAQPVLDEGEAATIVRASLALETLFGAAQDVEWAWHGPRLWLLQSRPITAISRADGPAIDGRWVLFKPLAENFTEPLTPMTADLFRRVLPPAGRFIGGRFYLNLDLARRLCPFRWSDRELIDVLLLRGEVPDWRWHWLRAPVMAAALAAAYLADGIRWHRSAYVTRDGLRAYEDVCQSLRLDDARDAASSLVQLILGRHPLEPIGRVAYYVNVSAGRYFLLLGLLNKLVERWAPEFDRHRLNQLCSGDGGTFSRQLVEGVRQLARTIRQDAWLQERFNSADGRELGHEIASLPPHHPLPQALARFLSRFGHRCLREMELAVPRWREDPLPVLMMARGHLRSPAPAPVDPAVQHRLVLDELERALPKIWQRRLAGYLVARIRHFTSLREDTRHYHAMAMDVTRTKLLDLEQRLLARGQLRLPGDVFYLTWDEARALDAQQMGWTDVAQHIRTRRREHREQTRSGAREVVGSVIGAVVTAPKQDGSDHGMLPPGSSSGGAQVLTGHCASPGTAEGPVRIVLDPAAANELSAGDVLVAPYTDPAWTPLFPLAAAVVVEVGSFLSHAGTVAREYGIPCLVEVEGCTRRLREGQRVRVCAGEGRVEVLSP